MREIFRGKLARAALTGSLVCLAAAEAKAGAFEIHEQSAQATSLSLAGVAAGGGGLGSMFWNPATITDYPGWQSSYSVSGIFPSATITAQPGSALLPLGASTGNMLQSALVPASYSSYQLSDRLWAGLAMNSPFGLISSNPPVWAGSLYGLTSKIITFDINPNLAYKVNDWLSVAAGVQAEYLRAYQSQAIGLPAPFGTGFATATVQGETWGFGYTLGATLKPWDGTEIGVGYRSRVQEDISHGNIQFSSAEPPAQPLPAGKYPASVNLELPDMVSVGLRQRITSAFTMLAGFEWDDWSLLGTVPIVSPGPLPPGGTNYGVINFRYRDGWMASLGGEYKWNDRLTLRAGTAYESSPITDATRQVTLPDSNRIWLSGGLGYQVTSKLTANLSYAHIFARSGTITYLAPAPLFATTQGDSNIFSVSLNYRWDNPSPPPPVTAKY